jgi:hypothetical protein
VLDVVGGYLLNGLSGAFIVVVLVVLETSPSFDDAVVNPTRTEWRSR